MKIIFQENTLKAMQKSLFFTNSKNVNTTDKKDGKFRYFQNKIIEHLTKLEKEAKEITKSFSYVVDSIVKSKFPVGTMRTWKGKKYIKVAQGKWRPKYDSETRGAKLSIAALKRKAEKCTSSKELLQLVLENRSRFSDDMGRPLPFVQELSRYVSGLNDKIENQSGIKTQDKKKSTKDVELHNEKNELSKESYTKILRKKLKNNLSSQFGFHKNKKTGIEANLSGSSVNKMSSDKAIEKSKKNGFSVDEHFEVANKIVSLYENSDLIKVSSDKKGSPVIKSIKRFKREVTLKNGERANAYITVKENIQNGHKIYSVEVIELEKNTHSENRAGGWQDNQKIPLTSSSTIPQTDEKSSDSKNEV